MKNKQLTFDTIEVEYSGTGYQILASSNNKFYGVHPDDKPFSEELLLARKNIRPLFVGDSKKEVQELIDGSKKTLLDLENNKAICTGMVFDGYATLDYIRRKLKLIVETNELSKYVDEGHFYSPIPSIEDIKKHAEKKFIGVPRKLAAINLHEDIQNKILHFLASEYKALPEFPKEKIDGSRYFYNNNNFAYFDAFALQSLIKYFKPKRIIETGSGFSSCIILDTNDKYFDGKIGITHIEPYPELLQTLTNKQKDTSILPVHLQDVDLDFFDTLGRNDILFIDTSHVTKAGSDVNHYLFDIFPRLQDGVVIHIHDIGLNFDYEIENMLQGRAWNESYILKAFLMYNQAFKIIFWNSFMLHFYPEIIKHELPLCHLHPGGSIWIQKGDFLPQ